MITNTFGKADSIFEKATDAASLAAQKAIIAEVCNSVADNLVRQPVKETLKDQSSFVERAVDGLTGGAYDECKAVATGKATTNDQIACARASQRPRAIDRAPFPPSGVDVVHESRADCVDLFPATRARPWIAGDRSQTTPILAKTA